MYQAASRLASDRNKWHNRYHSKVIFTVRGAFVLSDLVMPYDQFIRSFSLRKDRLSWFLGAGASASGGIPTAWEMSWSFKAQLYISQRKVPASELKDISHPLVRGRIQDFISESPGLPSQDAPNEYARLFEAAYPSASDRRDFLDSHIKQGKPSTGHIILALMMRDGIARVVWTTNFDVLIEDAFSQVGESTGALTTVGLDSVQVASQAVSQERWPLYGKIHGDFRSEFLKNSEAELAEQNSVLASELTTVAGRTGLVVTGYSGRDDSVMDLLEESLKQDRPFPSGLFWTYREGDEPYVRVRKLIELANERGVEASMVPIQNFDELMHDLANLLPDFDLETVEQHCSGNRSWSAAPDPSGNKDYPIIRLNAILVEKLPEHCKLINCDIGGFGEIRDAIRSASVDVIATRKREGVLAFGNQDAVEKAFQPFGLTSIDDYKLESYRLRYDSQERGLLGQAIATGIAEKLDLELNSFKSRSKLYPRNPNSVFWKPLREIVGEALNGTVSGAAGLKWFEGLEIQLDWADEKLWLLLEPRILFDGLNQENRHKASSNARERTFNRYNQKTNSLIDFWTKAIVGSDGTLPLFENETGAVQFGLNAKSGHSWRVHA